MTIKTSYQVADMVVHRFKKYYADMPTDQLNTITDSIKTLVQVEVRLHQMAIAREVGRLPEDETGIGSVMFILDDLK